MGKKHSKQELTTDTSLSPVFRFVLKKMFLVKRATATAEITNMRN